MGEPRGVRATSTAAPSPSGSSGDTGSEAVPPQGDPEHGDKKATEAAPKDPLKAFLEVVSSGANDNELKEAACAALNPAIAKHTVAQKYRLLVLHDEGSIVGNDADRIYGALNSAQGKLPILLVIYSPGGSIGPAYMISKLCRRSSPDRFVVAVPRKAKSAATLMCCGADEIHMGLLSELGPIDPQLDGVPALALKNSIEHMAELVCAYPKASSMFAEYLQKSLPIDQLGHYERLAESAEQYAERLLLARKEKLERPAKEVAIQLVRDYKDHSFVIDRDEAATIFGKSMIRYDTDEYRLANDMYERLAFLKMAIDVIAKREFYFVGSPIDGAVVYKPR